MNITNSVINRIRLLLAFLCFIVVGSFILFAHFHKKQLSIYKNLKLQSDRVVIDNVLNFKTQMMIKSTIDNAAWDLSVKFLKEKDSVWALNNYESTRITYGYAAIAIYDQQGKLFYFLADSIAKEIDFEEIPVKNWFAGKANFSSFYLANGYLYQISGSVIVPSWDIHFESPLQGYFLMFRRWDPFFQNELRESTGFNVIFIPHGSSPNFERGEIELIPHSLFDALQNQVGTLYFYREDKLSEALGPITDIMVIISVVIIVMMVLFIYLVRNWISLPIKLIAQSLRADDMKLLEKQLNKQDEFGEIARLINLYHDQKFQLENEIKEREEANEKFRTLLQAQPDTMLLVDSNGNIVYYYTPDKDLFERLYGKIAGKNIKDIRIPLLSDNFIRITRELTGTKKIRSVEYERYSGLEKYHFEARIIWVNSSLFLIILRDISNLKKIEIEIIRTKEILEQTSKIAQLGAWEYYPDQQQTFLSDITKEIFEIDEDFDPKFSQLIQFFKRGESRRRFIQALRSVYKTRRPHETEVEIVTLNGNEKWLRLNCIPEISNDKIVRVYGIVQDVTKQKKAEEQLLISEKNLRELNAAKDQFFSIIAHDLKAPFNGILGFGELLRMDALHLDKSEVVNYAGIIVESARQALQLLENLLDWAKLQQGRIIFQPRRILLSDLVDECILYISDSAISKNIAVTNTIPRDFIVRADPEMIKTVIRNLLSNAVKFTHPGGKITVSAQIVEKEVHVSVADTGIGIKEELLNTLFQMHPEKVRTGTASEKGAGFGLVLCKDFVEKHQGRIWVETKLYQGSVFTFSLPMDFARDSEASAEPATSPITTSQPGKISVLVVEDDPISAVSFAKILEKENFQVDIAYDGFKAIDFCMQNPDLDIIFMDLRMSKMDGLETTKKIREFNKKVVIVALTAIATKEIQEAALNSGCNDFLTKPYQKEDVMRIIKKNFPFKQIQVQ